LNAQKEEAVVKRFLLWDYPRASWQYDVMVGLILAFVFLTPRVIFRDQPRVSSVVMLAPGEEGTSSFWVEPELLSTIPEQQRTAYVAELLQQYAGKRRSLVRLEPMLDSEQEIKGYMAYTKP
jgi:hypothetical protein